MKPTLKDRQTACEQLLDRARQGPGWGIVRPAAQILRDDGENEAVRDALCRSLRVLGLEGLAEAVFGRVPVCEVRGVDEAELIEAARAHAALLPEFDVDSALACWREQGHRYHRALDGQYIRVPAGAVHCAECAWLEDMRGAACLWCAENLSTASLSPIGPIVLDGMCPPWMAIEVAKATPRLADGYQPPMWIVQPDETGLFESLAMSDVRTVLERARVFFGSCAVTRLSEALRARMDCDLPVSVIRVSTARPETDRLVVQAVQDVAREQKAVYADLRAALAAREGERDDQYWRARYAEHRRRRVLIPTTVYSTFVQHASRDLAEAFAELGWEARVLMEPDCGSRLSTVGYLRAQLDFDPDLIVLINYPRCTRAEAFPTQTPFVCWIQDSMPHLFDARVGRGHGPRDFVIGHVYPALMREFGYPPERSMSVPVVASARKFCHAPVQRPRPEIAMAYVSHHSETPQAMHDRLKREARDPAIGRVLDAMRTLLVERYRIVCDGGPSGSVKRIAKDGWERAIGTAAEPRVCSQLLEQYVVPMFERMLRHEMLQWASSIAQRRGWSLRLYGRGWEKHAQLSTWAAGVAAHDQSLGGVYRSACVHLHASMTTLVHQRVMECALSGGLPLCRLVASSVAPSRQRALARTVRDENPDVIRADDGWFGYCVEEHEPLRAYAAMCRSIGEAADEVLWVNPLTARNMKKYPECFEAAGVEDLLGDLPDVTFRCETELEACVERALNDDHWTATRSQDIAQRVLERFTHEVVAKRTQWLVEQVIGCTRD